MKNEYNSQKKQKMKKDRKNPQKNKLTIKQIIQNIRDYGWKKNGKNRGIVPFLRKPHVTIKTKLSTLSCKNGQL